MKELKEELTRLKGEEMSKEKSLNLLTVEIKAAIYPTLIEGWHAKLIAAHLWKCGWRKKG